MTVIIFSIMQQACKGFELQQMSGQETWCGFNSFLTQHHFMICMPTVAFSTKARILWRKDEHILYNHHVSSRSRACSFFLIKKYYEILNNQCTTQVDYSAQETEQFQINLFLNVQWLQQTTICCFGHKYDCCCKKLRVIAKQYLDISAYCVPARSVFDWCVGGQ